VRRRATVTLKGVKAKAVGRIWSPPQWLPPPVSPDISLMCENCNVTGTTGPGSERSCFPKTMRLRRSAEFKRVFDARQRVADDVLLVFGLENGLEHCRLGLSVSRKVGNAVVRNRWKRLIREAFRKKRACFSTPLDLVVLPQKGTSLPTARQVEESWHRLVERLSAKLPVQNRILSRPTTPCKSTKSKRNTS